MIAAGIDSKKPSIKRASRYKSPVSFPPLGFSLQSNNRKALNRQDAFQRATSLRENKKSENSWSESLFNFKALDGDKDHSDLNRLAATTMSRRFSAFPSSYILPKSVSKQDLSPRVLSAERLIYTHDEADELSERLNAVSNTNLTRLGSMAQHFQPRVSVFKHCGDHSLAQPWPYETVGIMLGSAHIILGLTFLIFDVATNDYTENRIAITSALFFIANAILCFIASRRLDRGTIIIISIVSAIALVLSLALTLQSLYKYDQLYLSDTLTANLHVVTIIVGLTEFFVCIATLTICYRSLMSAYTIDYHNISDPYCTYMFGSVSQHYVV